MVLAFNVGEKHFSRIHQPGKDRGIRFGDIANEVIVFGINRDEARAANRRIGQCHSVAC